MNKLQKYLLPFFPDNPFLNKYWWHRLAKIIICYFNISSYIVLAVFIASFLIDMASLPGWVYILLVPVFYFAYIPLKIAELLFGTKNYTITETQSILPLVFLMILLIPNIIYRIVIYISLGEKWKRNGEKK